MALIPARAKRPGPSGVDVHDSPLIRFHFPMFTPGGFRSCDVPSDNINDTRHLLSQNYFIICKREVDRSDNIYVQSATIRPM